MIVKNEEKNIERALLWARPIAYEQIVVDTGSTDNTVEIASMLGAKVFHFKWINNFSAARNFSIEQATGDWIIISDADEYMMPEDAVKLIDFLNRMEADPDKQKNCLVVNSPSINVDDEGKAMSVRNNLRVFRNNSALRFVGNIHERFIVDESNVVWTDEFNVVHTGYSDTSIEESGKIERNIEMLREAIALKPNDMALKVYLADNLKFLDDEESQVEAEMYFTEAINSGAEKVFYKLRIKAYVYFLNKYVNNTEKRNKCEELCNRALEEFPNSLDFEYFLASILNYKEKYQEAWDLLKAGELRMEAGENIGVSNHVQADPSMLFGQLMLAAQGLGNIDESIKYATLFLKSNKYQPDILSPYIFSMQNRGDTSEEIFTVLGSIYNLSCPNDLMFIARAARDCGAVEFGKMIVAIAEEMLSS